MPIIGVIDSSKTGNLFAASYESIATVTTTNGGLADFNNIPQTFTHLQIRVSGNSTYTLGGSGSYLETWIALNNTAGTPATSGRTHRLYSINASPFADNAAQTNLLSTPWVPYDYNSALIGTYVIDILDYTNTNKFKTIKAFGGFSANGAGALSYHSGVSNITATVQQIRVAQNAGGFRAGQTIALYGLKVA